MLRHCHRCLLVDEILHHVFSNFRKDDLAACVIVCRAWQDPASDFLWAVVDFSRILGVLAPTVRDRNTLRFQRSLTEEDWTRFYSLAPHVREVNIGGYRDPGLTFDSTLISELYRTNTNPLPLFPNIRNLLWKDMDERLSSALLGTTLRQFDASISRFHLAQSTLPRFLSQIVALTPNLTILDICLDIAPNRAQEAIHGLASMLLHIQHLRTINVNTYHVRGNAASILISLAELQELDEVEITCRTLSVAAERLTTERPFPCLRELNLTSSSVSGAPPIFKMMASYSRLRALVIRNKNEPAEVDVGELLPSLRGHLSLCSVEVTALRYIGPLSYRFLESLCGIPALIKLKLYTGGPLTTTDEELQSLASGLPLLQTLHLYSASTDQSLRLTINVLPSITTSCPFIEDIHITGIDASWPTTEITFPASSSLNTLSIPNAPIRDAQAVASFLGRLSDRDTFIISSFSWGGTEEAGRMRRLWIEVEESVPAIRRARLEDKAKLALTYK